MSTACPKCQRKLANPATAECPFCGIVLARYRARQHDPPRPPRQRASAPQPRPAGLAATCLHLFHAHRTRAGEWGAGKIAPLYGLALCFMVYVALRYALNPEYRSIFDGLNLAIHEGGHLLFRFFGTFIMIAGGTILQLLVPLACCFYFYRRPDFFGVAFCSFWLAANFYNVAVYVADARAQALPLVTVGGGYPIHDWNYLLASVGLLAADTTLAFLLRVMGFILIWVAIAYGGWLLKQMKSTGNEWHSQP